VKVTGCTVHFVDDEYDHGPIIVQRTVPVSFEDDSDSIAAKVFAAESVAYVEAIALYQQDKLRIDGGRVRIVR
jgi:phosphoribosylglycinamide formyltransferase-1